MAFLHVRIPDELDDLIRDRAEQLGFENPSQYVRSVLRRETQRELEQHTRCPNGCDRPLMDNVCQRCGSIGV